MKTGGGRFGPAFDSPPPCLGILGFSAAVFVGASWFPFCAHSRRTEQYNLAMPVLGIVEDILALDDLVGTDDDAARRETLLAVRDHIAQRCQGAKVADAAEVLGVSQPTVRAWLEAGILGGDVGARPIRIELISLANVKAALDAIRTSADDRQLLVQVQRVLRDRVASAGARDGMEDLRSGNERAIGDDLRGEIAALQRRRSTSSKST